MKMDTRLALACVCLVACSGAREQPFESLELSLPAPGIILGNQGAKLHVVELGSFRCRFCKEFHDDHLPSLQPLLHPTGQISFRFVNVDTVEGLVQLATWVGCHAEGMQAGSALGAVFDAVAAVDSNTISKMLSGGGLREQLCVVSRTPEFRAESRTASKVRVRTVPTFVIGSKDGSGRVVGWVVEGLDSARFNVAFRDAAQRLGISLETLRQ